MKLKPVFLATVLALVSLVVVACGSSPEESVPSQAAPATAAPASPAQAATTAPAPTSAPAPTTAPAAAASTLGGELKIAMRLLGNPQGLPSKASGGTGDSIPAFIGMMEALTVRTPETLWYEPQLAESYEVAPDVSKITINLRKGVQFHHGWGEMGAEDVKWSYDDAGIENKESVFGNVGYINTYHKPHVVIDKHTLEIPLKTFTAVLRTR